jgi:hypothetical protein
MSKSRWALLAVIAALIAIVMRKSLAFDTRKSALFWLAQSESDLALSYFSTLLAAQ